VKSTAAPPVSPISAGENEYRQQQGNRTPRPANHAEGRHKDIINDMWNRLTIGKGQHIFIGVDKQERFQNHPIHHRLMNTQRKQEVAETINKNRPWQAGVNQPQRLLDKCSDQMN
jgi:hypothetical protein